MSASGSATERREVPFTLHAVTDVARLRELGRTMHNCLGSYGDRLRGKHRIVEVRQAGAVRYAIHIERGRIVTFEAPGNRRPDPADVPSVRRLLEAGGYLAATIWAEPDHGGGRPAPVPPGQLSLPAADARPARRTAGPGRADTAPAGRRGEGHDRRGEEHDRWGEEAGPAGRGTDSAVGHPTARGGDGADLAGRPATSVRRVVSSERGARAEPTARTARTARTSPRASERVPGVSLQQIATEYLGPATLQSPDWTEVAAAMWASGLLPRLPSPTQAAFERVVRDLAGRVAIGEDRDLPRRTPPTTEERTRARRRLLEGEAADVGWQRRRMAAVLEFPVHP